MFIKVNVFIISSQSQKELFEKHHDTAEGRVRIWLGIRQIMNSTDRLLMETRDLAKELNTGIHMVIKFPRSAFYAFSCHFNCQTLVALY